MTAIHTYRAWREVPPGMLTASGLRELEFPRQPTGTPHALVTAENWRGKKDTFELYRAVDCPPSTASAAQLAAAAARSHHSRECAECGAHCQRPPGATDIRGERRLCPACLNVDLLRAAQSDARQKQAHVATSVAQRLNDWPDAAVVQVDLTTPPPTAAGTKRKPVTARIRACDLTGRRLVDVRVSLVSARSRLHDPNTIPPGEGAPLVTAALLGRPLICWSAADLAGLRLAVPHPGWPPLHGYPPPGRVWTAEIASAIWRGQLDDRRRLALSLPPGTPDRLLLHLWRIAATASPAHPVDPEGPAA